MTTKPEATILHIGLCTSDLARSLEFYTHGLGFELVKSAQGIGAPFDRLLEIPGSKMDIHQVKCGSTTIELLGLDTPVQGSRERRPMNQLGFTHLTLIVDDFANALQRIAEYGGSVIEESRVDSPYGQIVFCTDPDGVRIEIMVRPV